MSSLFIKILFSNPKLVKLTQRREQLIEQASNQRLALAESIEPWRKPLAVIDQGLSLFRFIRSHPVWIAGGAILLAFRRPRSLGKWIKQGWISWRIFSTLRS